MNHASREILGRIYVANFPCQLLARTMHQSYYLLIFKVNFSLKSFVSTRTDFVMVFGYFISEIYCKTSVSHEYMADAFLRNLREGDGTVSFSAMISYGVLRFFQKVFFSAPPAMSRKFCTVPYMLLILISKSFCLFYLSVSFTCSGCVSLEFLSHHLNISFFTCRLLSLSLNSL